MAEKNEKLFEAEIGGKALSVKTGKLAQQANASCLIQYGDTVILATATMSSSIREGIDYFPLMVDVEEKFYSAGRIMGSRFVRRERMPSDRAVLNGRLIDRAIRPYFDKRMRNDVQVILSVLSLDEENSYVFPAMVGASVALAMSDIPWAGPIAGVRVGRIDGEWVLNPTYNAEAKSEMDLFVAGTYGRVVMLEAGGNEVEDGIFYDAIDFAQKHIGKVEKFIASIVSEIGKGKIEISEDEPEEAELKKELAEKAKAFLGKELNAVLFDKKLKSKMERKAALAELKGRLDESLKEEQVGKEKREKALEIAGKLIEEEITKAILDRQQRVDGRGLDEVRALTSEVAVIPRVHGSGLFSRGATQVMSVVTLGGPGDEQLQESIEAKDVFKRRYMHHYNFPPYSVGETGILRASRRSIGHGALAEKALAPVLPDKEEFPYVIRVVSEVLGSNGSSSMGSACGSTLALMDAGIPIKRPVAGIAMGLASEENDEGITRYKILTDLQDMEDGEGGMDFKVAGTTEGITAIQLDTKTHGIGMDIVKETLEKAKAARLQILEVMKDAIAEPRPELSPYAPRIVCFTIDPTRIGEVIGTGGKIINKIIEETGVEINIEDDGSVFVCSKDSEASQRAVQWIQDLLKEVEVGEKYEGVVTQIMNFGAFVRILPGKEGLVHISKLANHRVEKVEDVVKIGDKLDVEVIEIDRQNRINLKVQGVEGGAGRPPRRDFGRGRKPFDKRRSRS